MSVDGGTTISMFFHPFTDWQVGHFLSACSPSRNESKHVYAVADPFSVGGRLRRPQTEMGISLGPMTINFDNHPIFKITIFRRENLFSPECHSKVVKFAKNERFLFLS